MKTTHQPINGIDTDALRAAIDGISGDPSEGMTHWEVTTSTRVDFWGFPPK
jgi:hypothetical protein